MERVLVGLVAVTLLAGASHGRADYVFICQLASPSTENGQFPNPRTLTTEGAKYAIVPEALNRQIEVFLRSYPFLAHFAEFGNGNGEAPEPPQAFLPTLGNPVAADWLQSSGRQLRDGGVFLGDFTGVALGGGQFHVAYGLSLTRPDADLVADTVHQGGGMSGGDYTFLARFGGLDLGESQPPRVVTSPAASGAVSSPLSNPWLLITLCSLVLGVLTSLVYAWRWRKRRLRRFLRGPRRTTLYRSPSLPRPPGKTL